MLDVDTLENGQSPDPRYGREVLIAVSGGCQLQPIPYPLQLAHKRHTVELAYQRFSSLPSNLVPAIGETIGSPKQWGYRTKLTPHFDAMPKRIQADFKKRAEAEKEAAESGGVKISPEEEGLNTEEVMNEPEELKPGTVLDADGKPWEVRIGFERKGRPGVMDIEVSFSPRKLGSS
jgi:tRNA (uracil-5-)-methyltransferase